MKVFIYHRSTKAVVQPLLSTNIPEVPPDEPFVPCVQKEVRVGPQRARAMKTFPIITGLMFVPEKWIQDDPRGTWTAEYKARPMIRWDIHPDDPEPISPVCCCDWNEVRPLWMNAQPSTEEAGNELQAGDRVIFLGGILEGYDGLVLRSRNTRVLVKVAKFLRPVECEASALCRS